MSILTVEYIDGINTVGEFAQLEEKLKESYRLLYKKANDYNAETDEEIDGTSYALISSILLLGIKGAVNDKGWGIKWDDTSECIPEPLLSQIKESLTEMSEALVKLGERDFSVVELEEAMEGFEKIPAEKIVAPPRTASPEARRVEPPREHAPSRGTGTSSTSRGGGSSSGEGIGLSEDQLAACREEIERKVRIYEEGNKRDGIPRQVLEKWDECVANPGNKFSKVYINKVLSIPGWVRAGDGPWTKPITVTVTEVIYGSDGLPEKDLATGKTKIRKVQKDIIPFDEYDSFKYMSVDEARKKLDLAMALAEHSGLEGPDIKAFFEYIIAQRQSELDDYANDTRQGSVRSLTGKRQAICLDGPPGTGKTSIAKIAAEILGLGYYEKTVAGQRGGHFVYGRGPEWESPELGLVAQAMASTYRKQVLVLSDEAEKATDTDLQMAYGDVLESNSHSYKDALLQCDFYKPTALHLLTTNNYELLAEHIQSRVVYKRIGGYSPEVKMKIAIAKLQKKYKEKIDAGEECKITIPISAADDLGLPFESASMFGDFDAVKFIIENYSAEQGVRELGAMIDQVFDRAKAARLSRDSADSFKIIDEKFIRETLGSPHPKILEIQRNVNAYEEIKGSYLELKSSLSSYRDELLDAMEHGNLGEVLNRILHDSGGDELDRIIGFLTKQKELKEFMPKYIESLKSKLSLHSGETAEAIQRSIEEAEELLSKQINQIPLLVRLAVERPEIQRAIPAGIDKEELLSADIREGERVAAYEREQFVKMRKRQQELAEHLRDGTLLGDLDDLGDVILPDRSEEWSQFFSRLIKQADEIGGEGSLEAIKRMYRAISSARANGRQDQIPDELFGALNVEGRDVDALLERLKERAEKVALDAQREGDRRLEEQQKRIEELRRLAEDLRSRKGESTPRSRVSSRSGDRRSSGGSTATTPGASQEADGVRHHSPTRKAHNARRDEMAHSPRDERRGSPLSSGRTSDPDAAFEATFTESRRVSSSYLSGRRDSSRPATLKYELSKLVTERMNFASDSAGNPEIVGMTKAPKNRSLDDSWSDIAGNTARFLEQANHDDLGDGDWTENAYGVYKGWEVTDKNDGKFTSVYSSKDGGQVAKVDYTKQDGAVKARASLDGFADPDVADKAIAQMLEVATRVYLETGKNKVNLNGLQDRPDLAVKFMEAAALLAQKDIKLKIVFDAPTVEAVMSNSRSAERIKDIAKIDPSGAEIVKESVNHEVVEPDRNPRHDRRGMKH